MRKIMNPQQMATERDDENSEAARSATRDPREESRPIPRFVRGDAYHSGYFTYGNGAEEFPQGSGEQSNSSYYRRNWPAGELDREAMRKAFCKYGMGGMDEVEAARWRPQREVVRDVLLSAAECGAWLTLAEMHRMTRFPESSIGAQVRALRTQAGGGFVVATRKRTPAMFFGCEPQSPVESNVWEYRIESRLVVDTRINYQKEEPSAYSS